jgi:hypothetical protein
MPGKLDGMLRELQMRSPWLFSDIRDELADLAGAHA